MSKTTDWLPTGRQNTFNMAKNWEKILNKNTLDADTPAVQPKRLNIAFWNIPG